MFRLVIGNKNLSSWSLRPWLVLKVLDEPFEEIQIDLRAADVGARIRAVSPTGKIPVLYDRNLAIPDSLAICEYLAECFPAARLWPESSDERALARAVCAEMHAGFAALRENLPMDICARKPLPTMTPALERDIERIKTIWHELRARHEAEGPFLFGHFTIADAFFAPVATRFVSYSVPLAGTLSAYIDTLMALPAMREWVAAAQQETAGAHAKGPLE
jgi:glutathione S-transferase